MRLSAAMRRMRSRTREGNKHPHSGARIPCPVICRPGRTLRPLRKGKSRPVLVGSLMEERDCSGSVAPKPVYSSSCRRQSALDSLRKECADCRRRLRPVGGSCEVRTIQATLWPGPEPTACALPAVVLQSALCSLRKECADYRRRLRPVGGSCEVWTIQATLWPGPEPTACALPAVVLSRRRCPGISLRARHCRSLAGRRHNRVRRELAPTDRA